MANPSWGVHPSSIMLVEFAASKGVRHIDVEEAIANLVFKDAEGNTIVEFPYELKHQSA